MADDPSSHGFKRILVGVDDSDDAQLGYRYAIKQARQFDATLILTSILESDDMNVFQAMNKNYVHGERQELIDHLNEYKKLAERAGVKNVEMVIDEGDPGETIVKNVIPAVDADLLIVGSNSKTDGLQSYFGSQASYMARHSPISIMIIR